MTKREKEKVIEAINILMNVEGDFHKGIWILAKLIGRTHEPYEMLQNLQTISLLDGLKEFGKK